LQVMAMLTVATSLVIKNPEAGVFRSPLKPLLQIIFLAFNMVVLVFTFISRPWESLIGIGILAAGLVVYFFDKPVNSQEVIGQ